MNKTVIAEYYKNRTGANSQYVQIVKEQISTFNTGNTAERNQNKYGFLQPVLSLFAISVSFNIHNFSL
jgi:hypothetical protein